MTNTMPHSILGEAAIALVMANRTALLAYYASETQRELAGTQRNSGKPGYAEALEQEYLALTEARLLAAVGVLNGDGGDAAILADYSVRETLEFENRLFALPEFGLTQLAYWFTAVKNPGYDIWRDEVFQSWLKRPDLIRYDLPGIDAALTRAGNRPDIIALACVEEDEGWEPRPQELFGPEQVWPLFAPDTKWLDQGLGLSTVKERRARLDLDAVLQVLALCPQLEPRWIKPLITLARGADPAQRDAAQRLLAREPDMWQTAARDLTSSKQEERSAAARWLGQLQDRAAVPVLRQALDRESRETVGAVLFGVLESLGEDMRARLTPEVLLTEARKGLKAKPPAGLAWFSDAALPVCRWSDGASAPPEILRWWVVLACKLKAPAANATLERYVKLLDAASRAALGSSILRQFIAHDTATPSLDQAIAHAQANVDGAFAYNQRCCKLDTDDYCYEEELTRDQVFDDLKWSKLSEYLGSAADEKGILALAFATPGQEAVALLKAYMREHGQRRHQLEAMLEALAVGVAPAVMQLLLVVAKRYKPASVQKKARSLIDQVALRHGWSAAQLAERTLPAGGLNQQGELLLDYGARGFYAKLDGALKLQLFSADGQPVAALPDARKGDDEELVDEAKQLLALCKKDVKQAQSALAAQLYLAMCAGRLWPQDEWREVLLEHPVAGRLLQTLLWIEVAADGRDVRMLRPAEDGSLLDIDDDAIILAPDSRLRLAHAALMSEADIASWRRHLKDYKVKPLFDQLGRTAVPAALIDGDSIADRLGWLGDTGRLRSIFGKLGYDRGQPAGGPIYTTYQKQFGTLQAVIRFSGAVLPEERYPAALKTLEFQSLEGAWRYRPLPLAQVPPVLLAEAYGDYLAAAGACTGYDAEWQRKVPW